MLVIKNVSMIDGTVCDLRVESREKNIIDASDLTLLPGLIDPHVHFRTPGYEYKEDWRTASRAAIAGGYTTVFDMPNTLPPTTTSALLRDKKNLIDAQLLEVGIPLRYQLFFGADKNHLNEIAKVRDQVVGIKVFMGCSTGGLVVDDDETLAAIFEIAAKENMLVAVHAEDECMMKENKQKYADITDYPIHSKIRSVEVAVRAVEKAIALSKKYGTRLYILHTSTKDEVELIRKAKQEGVNVYAETTPHHLFLNESYYQSLKGKALVNPPLRTEEHQAALWNAIHEGIIDTLGSDHAPHTVAEKAKAYGDCPSGMPSIEIILKLLLNAHHEKKLSLKEIVSLTSKRAREIFHLPENHDVVLVDLEKETKITDENLKTKCGWSPYAGRVLKGAPVYTVLRGQVFRIES